MKRSLLVITLLFTGCVTLDERIQRYGEEAGTPQPIIDAVKHGCNSGIATGGGRAQFKKDYELYKTNDDYRMRWDDSFALCKGRYEDNKRLIR